MKFKTQDYSDFTVVDFQGELTADFVDLFKSFMTDLVSQKKIGIVLDMSNMISVDSKGLEHLLWLRDYCNENSCTLKLAGLNEHCAKILEITKLQKEFDRHIELGDAVKSFA